MILWSNLGHLKKETYPKLNFFFFEASSRVFFLSNFGQSEKISFLYFLDFFGITIFYLVDYFCWKYYLFHNFFQFHYFFSNWNVLINEIHIIEKFLIVF